MKSVQEALKEILRDFHVCESELIPLRESQNRSLAQAVEAVNPLPPFDNSAMDGYGVRAVDIQEVPVRLTVAGEVLAGVAPAIQITHPGEAIRIMTGAVIPEGVDTVVPVEDTDDTRNAIALPRNVEIRKGHLAGAHIRHQGEDVQAGEQFFDAGHIIRPQDMGLLAGLGVAQVPVIRKPRVAIISTGNELLPPDRPLEPGKIRDMNSYTLPAMTTSLGAESIYAGIARDTVDSVQTLFHQVLEQQVDLIISSAGVSAGSHDVVRQVVETMGKLEFWKVNMRPGKPLAYGKIQGIPFMGLPGNPVSSLAGFEIFARPAILKMLGQSPHVPEIEVILGEDIHSDGRESYIRVFVEYDTRQRQLIARPTGTQSSGAISSLVKADALLVIPAGKTHVQKGDRLNIRPFAGQTLPALHQAISV